MYPPGKQKFKIQNSKLQKSILAACLVRGRIKIKYVVIYCY